MSKNYFQVTQKSLWKSNFFSGLNIEGITMDNPAFLLFPMSFLPGVFGLGFSYSKITSLQDVRASAVNPVLPLRNE